MRPLPEGGVEKDVVIIGLPVLTLLAGEQIVRCGMMSEPGHLVSKSAFSMKPPR